MNPNNIFRLTSGIFAGAAFYALINLVTISQPVPPCLKYAAVCFSVALIPLSILSKHQWPDEKAYPKQWGVLGWIYQVSTILFFGGTLCLTLYFGWGATIGTILAALVTGLALWIQAVLRAKRTR